MRFICGVDTERSRFERQGRRPKVRCSAMGLGVVLGRSGLLDSGQGISSARRSERVIEFTVLGVPQPQGSMKAFMPKRGKFPIVTNDNAKTKPWRQQVAGTCLAARGQEPMMGREVPVRVEVSFYFPRPKSVKSKAKTTRPDADKLLRLLCDALTGIAFEDDSQVTELHATKQYGEPPRMEVKIGEADV
jgi:Holliday junction resolvase RusA-like endonuclease